AVVAAVVALGLLLMAVISVVVLLTLPAGAPPRPPNGPPPKPPDEDTTPVVRGEQQRLPWPHCVSCVTASADGAWLLSGSDEPVPRVRVYDLTSGQLVQSFFGPKTAVRAVAVTPLRDRVLAVADDVVYIWEVE